MTTITVPQLHDRTEKWVRRAAQDGEIIVTDSVALCMHGTVELLATMHLASAAVNGFTEIYSNDRHLLAAARSFRVAERRSIIRIPVTCFCWFTKSQKLASPV